MSGNYRQSYLKFIQKDILIHTILLLLGTVLPGILLLMSFFFNPENNCLLGRCSDYKTNFLLFGLTILFFSGIVCIFWQLVSLFVTRKWKNFYSKSFSFCRKVVWLYYFLLVFSLLGWLFLEKIWGYYNTFSLISFSFESPLFVLFLASPIFWLPYYVFLFAQKRFLQKKSSANSEKAGEINLKRGGN